MTTSARVNRSRAAIAHQAKLNADGWQAVRARRAAGMFETVQLVSRHGNRVDRSRGLELHIARDAGLLTITDAGEWGYEVELTEKALETAD
jgi:hypothetical protein